MKNFIVVSEEYRDKMKEEFTKRNPPPEEVEEYKPIYGPSHMVEFVKMFNSSTLLSGDVLIEPMKNPKYDYGIKTDWNFTLKGSAEIIPTEDIPHIEIIEEPTRLKSSVTGFAKALEKWSTRYDEIVNPTEDTEHEDVTHKRLEP